MSDRTITFQSPRILAPMLGDDLTLEVTGRTIKETFDDAIAQKAELRPHIYDDAGNVRPNIQCIHNDTYMRALKALDREVNPGDTVTIINAVSGG